MCIVKFDSNGGSEVPSQDIVRGNQATKPTAPTKAGYSFEGWYNGDTKYDFTQAVTESITLTAQWKDIENPVITGIENDRTYCAEVEFEASDNDGRPAENNPNTGATVPQTGDNSNLFLWVALLFVSCFGVVVTTVCSKKRASAK